MAMEKTEGMSPAPEADGIDAFVLRKRMRRVANAISAITQEMR